MICSVHQPNYLPYSGFFEKAYRSDVFILYDITQFKKNDWQNRNRICTGDGWMWVSLPILHNFGQKICDVKLDLRNNPLKKNWNTLKTVYGKAPYFKNYESTFSEIYSGGFEFISELNTSLINSIAGILGLKTKFVKSSDLPKVETKSTQALIDLCRAVGADTYISGAEGKNYIDMDLWESSGIKIIFQSFRQPEYIQFNSGTFQPYMSIVDVLFNCGEKSLELLTANQNYMAGFQ